MLMNCAGNFIQQKEDISSAVLWTFYSALGEMYEVTGAAVKKNYHAGAQLIAYRDSGTLRYVFGDHLGSSTVTADASGGNVTRQLFKAWGETRSATSLATQYQYTGQYSYASDFGLHFYRARFYDPALGRFVSADSIIPEAGNPLAWDRYAGMANNAVRNVDPSGHAPYTPCTDDWCGEYNMPFTGGGTMKPAGKRSASESEDYRIALTGFSSENLHTIRAEFHRIANKLWAAFYSFVCGSAPCPDIDVSPVEVFKAVFGPMTWNYQLNNPGGCNADSLECGGDEVSNYSTRDEARGLMTHEFGHLFDHRITSEWGYGRGILHNATILIAGTIYVSGYIDGVGYKRTALGYLSDQRPAIQHTLGDPRGCGGGTACEDFADMFMNWVQDSFSEDPYGQARYNWMEQRMGSWVVSSVYHNP